MSDRLTLLCYGIDERWALLRSPQWIEARDLLRRAGVRAMWSRRLRGWCVRTERVGDVLAVAQFEGVGVVMRGALEKAQQ